MSEVLLVVGDDSQICTDCMIHGKHRTRPNRMIQQTGQRQTWTNRQYAKKRGVSYSYTYIQTHFAFVSSNKRVIAIQK
jgi:hypothetical protein